MNNKKLIAGNWKMNSTVPEAEDLTEKIVLGTIELNNAEVAIFPPAVYLEQLYLLLAEYNSQMLSLGIQNVSWESSGAFTGDIAIGMVKQWIKYAIIGHSERRKYFSETNVQINKKIKLCLKNEIVPILCIGEKRLLSSDVAEVGRDLDEGLVGIEGNDLKKIVVAYEPVWAIGTGQAAEPSYVNNMMRNLRNWLKDSFGFEVAESIRMLYGGSVDDKNAGQYLKKDHVDGLLVGGASLKADKFLKIVKEAEKIKS